LLIVFLNV